jgi:cysteine desulfurase
MSKVYLDYNATAPIRPEVLTLVTEVMGNVGNASSVHEFGRTAHKYVEDAREQVAKLCAVAADQVTFTSGATESINTVLSGFRDQRVLISAIEHPAMIASTPHAEQIPVTADGIIDMDAYKKMLNEGKPPALVSVMLVNSETGVIQPVKEMAKLAHDVGALFHSDAVQGAGRINISLDTLGVDYISLSAHKFAGPQGVGAIIKRENLGLPKFMLGGGQEKNCRAGTHNTAGIAGMGLAAELALKHMPEYAKIQKLRDNMEVQILEIVDQAARPPACGHGVIIYGGNAPRVGNTTNVGLPSIPAQTQMMALDLDGISVSSGSACSSGAFKASHVLIAMGASEEQAKSALRISMGWNTTKADIDRFLESWSKIVKQTQ